MADIASVAIGLKNLCSSVLYPNGTAAPSITGRHTIVQRGWLTETDITGQCSLKSGVDYVTITALAGAYKRIGERLGMPWRSGVQTPCSVGITSAGKVVTITAPTSGAPTGIVGVRIVSDGMSSVASYAIAAADTAATIAAALAAQIVGATAVGASLTAPGSVTLETASTDMSKLPASRVASASSSSSRCGPLIRMRATWPDMPLMLPCRVNSGFRTAMERNVCFSFPGLLTWTHSRPS